MLNKLRRPLLKTNVAKRRNAKMRGELRAAFVSLNLETDNFIWVLFKRSRKIINAVMGSGPPRGGRGEMAIRYY